MHDLRTRRLIALSAMPLAFLSGCSRQSVSGDSVTYGYGWVPILVVVLVGIALVAIGGMRIADNRRIAAQQLRRKRKKEPSENEGAFGLIYGIAILTGGLGMLTLLAPSLLLSYVTVRPDKVEIRDSLFWLTSSAREIPFADTASLHLEEREVVGRRGAKKIKKYLHIARRTGAAETIEMQAMHRDAWPDWEAKYQAFAKSNAPAAAPAESNTSVATVTETSSPGTAALATGEDSSQSSGVGSSPQQVAPPIPAKEMANNTTPSSKPPKFEEPTLANPGPEFPDSTYLKRGYKILAGPKLREATVLSVHQLLYVRVKYLEDGTEALVSHVETDECPGVAYGDVIDELLHARRGVAICVMKVAGQKNGAKVLDIYSDHKIRVRYLSGEEELVSFGHTLHPSALTGKFTNEELVPVPEDEENPDASAAIDASELGAAVRSTEVIPPDTTVYAEYKGRWLPVWILSTTGRGKCLIHWIGWPREFDTEWQMTKLKKAKE